MSSSEIFRMTQRALLMRLYSMHGRGWTIGAVALVGGLTVWWLVTGDLRILICALISIFIIFPMVIAFLFINYALTQDVAFNVLPHNLTLTPSGLLLTIYPFKDKVKEVEDPSDNNKNQQSGLRGREKEEKSRREKDIEKDENQPIIRNIAYSQIGGITLLPSAISFTLDKGGFLYLPESAFPSQKEFQSFIEELLNSRNLQDNRNEN